MAFPEFTQTLAILTAKDVPVKARYQRSDILAWLMCLWICEHLKEDPQRATANINSGIDRLENAKSLDPILVSRIREEVGAREMPLLRTITADTDWATHFRQLLPKDIVTNAERDAIFEHAVRLYKEAKSLGWAR